MTYIIQYLSKAFTTSSLVLVGMIALLSFLPSQELAAEDEDVFTDIILINGQAELADFNKDGQILMRHTAVPDYFSSGRSHKRSLRNSLKKLKIYGSAEPEKPVFYHVPVECRQSLMAVQEVTTDDKDSHHEVSVLEGLYDLADLMVDDLNDSIVFSAAAESASDKRQEIANKILNPFFKMPKQRLDVYARFTCGNCRIASDAAYL